jgi:hypothetical protein
MTQKYYIRKYSIFRYQAPFNLNSFLLKMQTSCGHTADTLRTADRFLRTHCGHCGQHCGQHKHCGPTLQTPKTSTYINPWRRCSSAAGRLRYHQSSSYTPPQRIHCHQRPHFSNFSNGAKPHVRPPCFPRARESSDVFRTQNNFLTEPWRPRAYKPPQPLHSSLAPIISLTFSQCKHGHHEHQPPLHRFLLSTNGY